MARLQRALANSSIVAFCSALVVALAVLALRATGALQGVELKAYDWQLTWRGATEIEPAPIVIVRVTESEIRAHGWPLSDGKLAVILNKLAQAKARAIGLDIYRDLAVAPGQQEFADLLRKHPNIVVATKYPEKNRREVPPPQVLKGTRQAGVNDVLPDDDGVVRRGIIYLDDGISPQSIAYSLATRLVLLYLGKEALEFDAAGNLILGRATLRPFERDDGGYVHADAAGYQFLLDLRDALSKLATVTVADVLADRAGKDLFENKVVLIGVTAESVPDEFHLPVPGQRDLGHRVSGVELHALIAAQLLRFAQGKSRPVAALAESTEWFLVVLGSLLGSAIGLWVRSPWRYGLALVSSVLLFAGSSQYALMQSIWLPFVPAVLALLSAALMMAAHMSNQEKLQRNVLMKLFSRHVSPEVAAAVWRQREEFLDGGRPRPQRLMATVLFTDLVNFTSVAEKKEPEDLLTWLNEYMDEMASLVSENGGVVKQYIGDSIMAVFGVPVPRKTEAEICQDAIHAVTCALAMRLAMVKLNQRWAKKNAPTIAMRVGIFTGPMVVGSLGSDERSEYALVGDSVNTASRLESFEKEQFVPDYEHNPCRILIGESTRKYLGDDFIVEKMGRASLKGKDEEILVYSVRGRCTSES